MQLESYGSAENPRRLETPIATRREGTRLVHEWDDALLEWWDNAPAGLEHGFTVLAPPAGTNDFLVWTLSWNGELRPLAATRTRAVRFVDAEGAPVLDYAGLAVFDASGQALDAWIDVDSTALRLWVDVRGAQYPLEIDPTVQQAYLKASNTDASDAFGDSIAAFEDRILVGAPFESSAATGVNGNQNDNSAPASGAAYIFRRNGATWVQEAYLKASNTGANDWFGFSVALDDEFAVVGAISEDGSSLGVDGPQNDLGLECGAAYVYRRSGTTWTQVAYLKASNTDTGDHFGERVALWKNRIAIAAPHERSLATGIDGNQADNSGLDSGAVYVFHFDGAHWSQEAYVKASNTNAGDSFGVSLALGDQAGLPVLLVGADEESSGAMGLNGNQTDNSMPASGAVYAFSRPIGGWSQEAYIKASTPDAADRFGSSIAVDGLTAVVGARGESSTATGVDGNQSNNGAPRSGAAYVFSHAAGSWVQQAYLKATNTDSLDLFGGGVAVQGERIVVTAPREYGGSAGINGDQTDNSVPDAGSAYVFGRCGTTWRPLTYVKASNPNAFDGFGWSVAISQSYTTPANSPLVDYFVVSAVGEASAATGVDGDQADNSAPNAGAAYVMTGLYVDCDNDGLVDACEADCNGDLIPDECQGGAATITSQPTNQIAVPGQAASFVVTVTGPPPFAYQWRRNGTALPGGSGSSAGPSITLTLASVSAADLGAYDVLVTDACGGSTTSNTATLDLFAGSPMCFGDGWDSADWTAMATGLASPVRALIAFDFGTGPELVAGTDTGVSVWNGTSWSALGTLNNGAVNALVGADLDGPGGNPAVLYAGGMFTQSPAGAGGGQNARRIARWDGAAWQGLGSGAQNGLNDTVHALTVFGSPPALFVGGDFTSAGGTTATRIALWDGFSWSSAGMVSGTQGVTCFATYQSNLHAGVATGGGAAAGLYRSSGQGPSATWTQVLQLSAGLSALAEFDPDGAGPQASDLYVGGPAGLTRLSDSFLFGVSGTIDDFAVVPAATGQPGLLYMAGSFASVSGRPAEGLASFDGSHVMLPAGGVRSGVSVGRAQSLCLASGIGGGSTNRLHVGGTFDSISGTTAQNVAAEELDSLACPCGNSGDPGRGCANSTNPAGALLTGTGEPSLDTLILHGSGMPASSACIYLQGDLVTNLVFGDGVRCAGGNLIRLRTRTNVAGASDFPLPGDPSVATRGLVTPGSGVVRSYQTYYRNAASTFCLPATFNVTNGVRLTW
ncbi:MAG: immunoglobulin domain-containing protein [Planctomycetes bacterium]|nr:immunoglobulin domain-containing protein [Planctomycetota bacterium]